MAAVAVPGAAGHRVRAQQAHARGELLVGGEDHPALAHASCFLEKKRQAARGRRRRRGCATPKRLRGVLDQRQPGASQSSRSARVGRVAAACGRR